MSNNSSNDLIRARSRLLCPNSERNDDYAERNLRLAFNHRTLFLKSLFAMIAMFNWNDNAQLTNRNGTLPYLSSFGSLKRNYLYMQITVPRRASALRLQCSALRLKTERCRRFRRRSMFHSYSVYACVCCVCVCFFNFYRSSTLSLAVVAVAIEMSYLLMFVFIFFIAIIIR